MKKLQKFLKELDMWCTNASYTYKIDEILGIITISAKDGLFTSTFLSIFYEFDIKFVVDVFVKEINIIIDDIE